MSVLYLNNLGL